MTTFADRRRSRSRSRSGARTCAAATTFTAPTWRSSKIICAIRWLALIEAGLAADEAFLVAVKRMGSLDALSREFARAHSDRLWKQLLLVRPVPESLRDRAHRPHRRFCLAVAAAVAIKVPALFGHWTTRMTTCRCSTRATRVFWCCRS